MKPHFLLFYALLCFKSAHSYSKFGRTCKDIGCSSNEECVMAETPCSYSSRENECGMYPTCKRISNAAAPSCATYVCPPTKKCVVEGNDPKCVDDVQANVPGNQNGNKAYQAYDTENTNYQPPAPNAPPNPNSVYPVLAGQTTTRAPIRRPPYSGGGGSYQGGSVGSGYPGQGGSGYQGGSVGSGYPGQGGGGYQGGNVGSGYPGQAGGGYQGGSVGSGYPGQAGGGYQGGNVGSGYPGQSSGGYQGGSVGSGYPGQGGGGYQGGSVGSGYPGQAGGAAGSGYPRQPGGYQGGATGSGYPGQGGYQGRYPQQGSGYQHGYQPGYGNNYNRQQTPNQQSSGSNPLYDKVKNTLASYGTSLLKNALGNIKF